MPPQVLATQFVLAVPSLAEAESYWCGVLGFAHRDSPPGWLFLALDGAGVMLGECPDDPAPAVLGSHSYFGYFHLGDLDAYAAAIAARGALVLAGPADKPWGQREMAVATPAGHRMMFAQRLGQDAGSDLANHEISS
jgi:catechol 2,3-dioxygenase-like lactoylglutathione lyase family enzyme